MNEDRVELVANLIVCARQREAAARIPDCIDGAQKRLDAARDKLLTALQGVNTVSGADERVAGFLDEIVSRTANGEWIAVQYHPNGDWSVANAPIAGREDLVELVEAAIAGEASNEGRARATIAALQGAGTKRLQGVGYPASCAPETSVAPTAPEQDDDAEWLRANAADFVCSGDHCGGHNERAEALSRLERITTRLSADHTAVLAEALEPFAKVADAFDYWSAEVMPQFSYPTQSCDLKFALEDCPNAVGELTESDFIRARTALAARVALSPDVSREIDGER